MSIDATTISFALGISAFMGVIFSIYLYFRNPQIAADKAISQLTEDVVSLSKVVAEIKEKHLTSVEADMKKLTETIQQLSTTVVRLGTIIDERIPRSNN